MSADPWLADQLAAAGLAGSAHAARFDPAEKRGFHGKWVKVGGSDFKYDGPAGGDGHTRAVMAVADLVDKQPGMADAATNIRNSAKAMVARDMAAANRHLDGAAYLDGIYAGGFNRDNIEAVRKSYADVPKGTVTEPRESEVPAALGKGQRKLKGQPVTPGVVGAYAGARRTDDEEKLPWPPCCAQEIELDRAFNPRELRDPRGKWSRGGGGNKRLPLGPGPLTSSPSGAVTDYSGGAPLEASPFKTGRWVAAGDAHHLHGQTVTGRHIGGREVTGRFDHGSATVQPPGKPPVKVSHVRKILHAIAEANPFGSESPPVPNQYGIGAVGRTAETATASSVHEPIGAPGGPGLWKHKTWQLPPYIQHVAHHLIDKFGESRGIEMAVGIVKNWAAGHDGKGHQVTPEVQAAAAKNIAQWEAMKARTAHGAKRSADMGDDGHTEDCACISRAQMATADINNLPDEAFAYIEPGGKKDSSGKTTPREKRHFPVHDKAHVANALSRAPQSPFGDKAMPKIKEAARKMGIGQPAAEVASRSEMFRYWPLEECRIMRADEGREYASGRVVEAYAAVFGQEAEIRDHEGHYLEDIDRGAFDDVLRVIHPARNGGFWRATCLYNHGMTVHGTPAERFSLPAGVPMYLGSEGKGLLTRTEYAQTPLGEELLELVNMGALRSQSFTGGIVRSDPMLRGPGDRYGRVGGQLQRVRRLVLGLREYGLTPFAAYSGAEVLGVRMQLPGGLLAEEDYAGDDDLDAAAPADGGGSGDSPEAEPVSRSTGNRLYRLRTEELLKQHGISLP